MTFPNLDPCHIGQPFVLVDSQMVRLWESFFNVLWARDFARPGQPVIVLRPYRGAPHAEQPDPRGLRQGETFDACVSLLYRFVGERSRG
eukprot:15440420-Alexandrium_andersonii.AAC.1